LNENPIPLTFSPNYSAEKWNAIAALLDDLAPRLPEVDLEDPEIHAPERTNS
jgi:hypothetical protein